LKRLGLSKEAAMKCINCEKEARAICKFCGRAVCEDHISAKTYVSGYTEGVVLRAFASNQDGVSVDDAVWCGKCHPEFHRTV
jgi:hypothetical protein